MSEAEALGGKSSQSQMAAGAFWGLLLRLGIRSLGLVSTLILVRILAPADFGLVAMATLVTGVVELLTLSAGEHMALVRHPGPTRDHYDTAWTISVIKTACAALITLALAPLAGTYFAEPRLVPVIMVLAMPMFVVGLENIRIVDFMRSFRFGCDFGLMLAQKLIMVGLTVPAALYWQDYKALLLGQVAAPFLYVALTFAVRPYRPRPTLCKLRELLSFSVWASVSHMGDYMSARIDQFVVGRLTSLGGMGYYAVAVDFARFIIEETILSSERALFSVYSRLADDREALRRSFLVVLQAMAHAGVSMGVGLAGVSTYFAPVVLGPEWSASAPIIFWAALGAAAVGISGAAIVLLRALGQVGVTAALSWLRVLALLLACTLAGVVSGVEGVAAARAGILLFFVPIVYALLCRYGGFTAGELLKAVWRPAAAGLVLAAALGVANPTGYAPPLQLALMVLLGIAAYVGAAGLLWAVSGCPPGIEANLVRFLQAGVGRLWGAGRAPARAADGRP